MKKLILTTAFISFVAMSVFSQTQNEIDKPENQSEDKNVKHTLNIDLVKRSITVEEGYKKTNITVVKKNDQRYKPRNFRGHLAGFGIGYNNVLTDFWSKSLKPGEEYFDINSSSKAWSIMFPSVDVEITKHFGIVSAIGITLNNYHFNGNNNITKGVHGVILPLYPDQGIVYKKSKLHTGYINIPVMLELQIPTTNRKTINLSGGIVGAVKLWSKSKMVWNDGRKHKEKRNSDFNLNVLRWGTTARVGYGHFQVYGTTYFTPMFEKGKGPELYPFEAGVVFNWRR